MDVALCKLEGTTLSYSGANNPLWIVKKEKLIEIKANKQPISKFEQYKPFTTHTIELEKGDSIYVFSDGYPDQFGGEKGKKYKSGKFKKFLLSIQEHSMGKQHKLLDQEFESWKGKLEQIDDVCVLLELKYKLKKNVLKQYINGIKKQKRPNLSSPSVNYRYSIHF